MEAILPPLFLCMKYTYYSGCFGSRVVCLGLRHPETAVRFGGYLDTGPLKEIPAEAACVPEEAFREWVRNTGLPAGASAEFSLAAYSVSDALLRNGACVFHAAALYFRGRAWLFAAESGTGKSTQLANWMRLYPDDGSRIMNGDKPVLRVTEKGTAEVCPSPWRGKEGWGDDNTTAPLGGVILLRQGKEDRLAKADPFRSAARLLSCFFSRFETEEAVRGICGIEDKILRTVPVWELVNTGGYASTELIRGAIEKETENDFPQG